MVKLHWPWFSYRCDECSARHWVWRGFWGRRRLPSQELPDNSVPMIISDVRLLGTFSKEGLVLTRPIPANTVIWDEYDSGRHVISPDGLCSCGFGMEVQLTSAPPKEDKVNAQDQS